MADSLSSDQVIARIEQFRDLLACPSVIGLDAITVINSRDKAQLLDACLILLRQQQERPRIPQTTLIEAAAVVTTLRREADHLDAYTHVPCQSENAWHARDYRRWAQLIDDLVPPVALPSPPSGAEE
jgi:hypothetical protein